MTPWSRIFVLLVGYTLRGCKFYVWKEKKFSTWLLARKNILHLVARKKFSTWLLARGFFKTFVIISRVKYKSICTIKTGDIEGSGVGTATVTTLTDGTATLTGGNLKT